MATEAEIAWAAGLFEGEGTFGTYRMTGGYWLVQAAIMMTDRDVLERFVSIVGVGDIKPVSTENQPAHHKLRFMWKVCAKRDVQHVISTLGPWLCSRRSAKAREVVHIMDTKIRDRDAPRDHCRKGHPMTDDNLIHETSNGKRLRRCKTCRNASRHTVAARAKEARRKRAERARARA